MTSDLARVQGDIRSARDVLELSRVLAPRFGCATSIFLFERDAREQHAISSDGKSAAPFDDALVRAIHANRRFGAASTDRFPDRPVRMDRLYRRAPRALERFRRAVLEPLGAWWQLRVTLYDDDGALIGHIALARTRQAGDFDARAITRLGALVPALREHLDARARLAASAIASTQMLAILDAWDVPVYVLSPRGSVAWASASALALGPAPSWLAEAGRRGAARVPADVRTRTVEFSGVAHTVVLLGRESALACHALGLPPRLARIATLAARGAGDKEIAARCGLSVATVRTYVTQVYARTGAHNRAELAWLLYRVGGVSIR